MGNSVSSELYVPCPVLFFKFCLLQLLECFHGHCLYKQNYLALFCVQSEFGFTPEMNKTQILALARTLWCKGAGFMLSGLTQIKSFLITYQLMEMTRIYIVAFLVQLTTQKIHIISCYSIHCKNSSRPNEKSIQSKYMSNVKL